ncbi:MAG: tRNA (guanosine(37)-N1)-methyltransferase TrmD [Clostridia bacterium]|nr:tRNA (guanosine(37)-N1)-methyltransferase TrmD [Clostridia bacterium]
MKIDILTLFPEMFAPIYSSMIGRAIKSGAINVNIVDIRTFSKDKHSKCDDTPYGGGAGMVMMAQPIIDATRALDSDNTAKKIYLSPRGKVFNQTLAKEYSAFDHLILLCGHYEGVDERALELCAYEELSIGDYILTGGELPAMIVLDSVSRFVPGVLGSAESCITESFSDGLLEYPQYTKPAEIEGKAVPEVLISGHHANIEKWRKEKALEITLKNRPDLLNKDK